MGKIWELLEGPVACAAYIAASLAMTTVNKYTISVLKFPGMNFLLLVECLSTAAGLFLLHPSRYSPFRGPILQNLPQVTLTKAGNMCFSFLSMRHTSLPVYNVLKRMTSVFALVVDFVIRGTRFSKATHLGISLIMAGAITTGSGDLEFEVFGYVVAILAAISQASYLVLSARAVDRVGRADLTHMDLLFYTAFFNIILFIPLAGGEAGEIKAYFLAPENGVDSMWRTLGTLVVYVGCGAFLNYTLFWCTATNSPVTTGVAGNFKAILSTWIGVVYFSSSTPGGGLNPLGWLGLVLNTSGGVLYSLAKALETQQQQQEAERIKREKGS